MLRISLLSCLIFLAAVALVVAQGPVGTMTGTVTDPAGASVPGRNCCRYQRCHGSRNQDYDYEYRNLHAAISSCRRLHDSCHCSRISDRERRERHTTRCSDPDRRH